MDTPLLWPTLEGEIPTTSPLKGRPDIHTQSNTQVTQRGNTKLTWIRDKKDQEKKLNAESSISNHHNSSDDENINDLAYIHKTINGKRH